jgi:hypothetical protein
MTPMLSELDILAYLSQVASDCDADLGLLS